MREYLKFAFKGTRK